MIKEEWAQLIVYFSFLQKKFMHMHFTERWASIIFLNITLKYTDVWNSKYQLLSEKLPMPYGIVPVYLCTWRHLILNYLDILFYRNPSYIWLKTESETSQGSWQLRVSPLHQTWKCRGSATDMQATRMGTRRITPKSREINFFLFLWRDWGTVWLCSPECSQTQYVVWAIFELMVILLPWPKC